MIEYDVIKINTGRNVEIINITSKIEDIVKKSEISNGLINISTKHTTSSIMINEDENGLKKDYINFIEKIVIHDDYFHDRIDNNARSHLMSMLSSQNQTLPVLNGKLSLGVWQSIFFVEFDGPRNNREIIVTLISE